MSAKTKARISRQNRHGKSSSQEEADKEIEPCSLSFDKEQLTCMSTRERRIYDFQPGIRQQRRLKESGGRGHGGFR